MYKINVYKIFWNDNSDLYVGSTRCNLSIRMSKHRAACKKNQNHDINIAINKYGLYNFNYCLLKSYDVCNIEEQHKWEQYHIDILKPNIQTFRIANYKYNYNKKYYIKHKK